MQNIDDELKWLWQVVHIVFQRIGIICLHAGVTKNLHYAFVHSDLLYRIEV